MANAEKAPITMSYSSGGIPDRTIGRFFAILPNLVRATPEGITGTISPEMAHEITQRYADVEWKDTPTLNINKSPLFSQLKRLWSQDRQANGLFRATVGTVSTVGRWIGGRIGRVDNYNPYSNTVTLYTGNWAIITHRMGLAQYFDKSQHISSEIASRWFGYNRIFQDREAIKNASNRIKPEEKEHARHTWTKELGNEVWGRNVATVAAGVDVGINASRLFR